MTEIGFYHLTRTDIMAALPALLGRTLSAGERALVLCPDEGMVTKLDTALWLVPTPDWLPHGTAASAYPQWQPVLLTSDGLNPNGASYAFVVGGAVVDAPAFKRVFDLFDGTDEAAVTAARARWLAHKQGGYMLTYWKQGDAGWEKAV